MRVKENSNQPGEQKVVGSHLKHLREEKGLSVEDVFAATKISVANLKAIEEHDFSKLPADTFTRGLITLYGNFLGIDGQLAAHRFIAERGTSTKSHRSSHKAYGDHSLAPKKLAEPSHIPSATVAALLLVLIILSFTAFSLYTSWNPFTFFTDTTKDLTSSVMAVFDDAPMPELKIIEGNHILLQARFVQNASVEVTIDDQPTLHQEYTNNRQVQWRATGRLLLRFSEPASAQLTLNGQPLPFPEEHTGAFQLELHHTPRSQ